MDPLIARDVCYNPRFYRQEAGHGEGNMLNTLFAVAEPRMGWVSDSRDHLVQKRSMEPSNSKCGKSQSGARARACGSQAGGVSAADWELGEMSSGGPKE